MKYNVTKQSQPFLCDYTLVTVYMYCIVCKTRCQVKSTIDTCTCRTVLSSKFLWHRLKQIQPLLIIFCSQRFVNRIKMLCLQIISKLRDLYSLKAIHVLLSNLKLKEHFITKNMKQKTGPVWPRWLFHTKLLNLSWSQISLQL